MTMLGGPAIAAGEAGRLSIALGELVDSFGVN